MRACFLALVPASLALSPLHAQCVDEPEAVVQAAGLAAGDRSGHAVTLGDGWLFAGAPGADAAGQDSGIVTVFQDVGGTWVEVQTLEPNDAAAGFEFGTALAYDGGTLMVGAPGRSFERGAVYVFEQQGGAWTQLQRLNASAQAVGERFGMGLDLSKLLRVAVIANLGGDAQLFTDFSGAWLHHQDLVYPGGGDGAGFGEAVAVIRTPTTALFADLELVVGAPRDTFAGGPPESGSAWVFDRFCVCSAIGWEPFLELVPDDPLALGHFGTSVGISNGQSPNNGVIPALIVGSGRGVAYVWAYAWPAFSLAHVLNPFTEGPVTNARLVVDRDLFVLSGERVDGQPGPTFLYKRAPLSKWGVHDTLTASSLAPGSGLGFARAYRDGLVVTGAPASSGGGELVVHQLGVGPNFSYCPPAPNSGQPDGTHLERFGSTSISENGLDFQALGPRDQTALLFYGAGQQSVPFGDGTLCVSGPFYRVGVQTFVSNVTPSAFGAAAWRLDFSSPPADAGAGLIASGSRWNLQLWFRDPVAGGAGFGLSDAVSLEFCP